MANTFLHPLHELHYHTYQPNDVAPALDATEKIAWGRIDALLAIPDEKRTFENTVLALTGASEKFEYVVLRVKNMALVMGDVWHEAEALADERMAALASEIMQHQGIYKALCVVAAKTDYVAELPATHQKLLSEQLREYRREGIELDANKKATLKQLDRELAKLSATFSQNLSQANDTAGVHILQADELAGLDQEFINESKAAAKKKGLDGYWLGYSEPVQAKVMGYCAHTPTRAAYYKMAVSRASALNTSVAQSILKLRKQRAGLLGYPNHAEYMTETRMAGSAQTASTFISSLTEKYQPKAWQEYEQLLQFARDHDKDQNLTIGVWEIDVGLNYYYANLLRQELCGFNEQAVSEYFPLSVVRNGMFEVLSTLYGVTFRKAPAGTSVWHPDVEVYEVYDTASHHIASVRCDWFARPGKKGGAWMHEQYIADRSKGSFDRPHLASVVANFSSPTATKPSLLTIREVETMWHEFGHFMHLALSRTELTEQSMAACKWDFIEAPSQIMENWVWQPEILRKISQHYQTSAPLPDELIDKLLSSQNFRVGQIAMRQFYLATVDLQLHTTFDPEHDDILAVSKDHKAKFLALPPEQYEASITSFAHIFSGDYSAGYYGYKWAEAIQADLFSRFTKEGILSPTVGQAYAETILARGDEEEPQVLVRAFLGRNSSIDAMLRRDEIVR